MAAEVEYVGGPFDGERAVQPAAASDGGPVLWVDASVLTASDSITSVPVRYMREPVARQDGRWRYIYEKPQPKEHPHG